MRSVSKRIYRNLPVFLVILDTVLILYTQVKRRFSHVPNLILEVTALRLDV